MYQKSADRMAKSADHDQTALADVQADLSLCLAHSLNYWICHAAAHLSFPEEEIRCVFDNNYGIILLISS